jgi:hypothetical protein
MPGMPALMGIGPAASIWTRKLFPDIAAQHIVALMGSYPEITLEQKRIFNENNRLKLSAAL